MESMLFIEKMPRASQGSNPCRPRDEWIFLVDNSPPPPPPRWCLRLCAVPFVTLSLLLLTFAPVRAQQPVMWCSAAVLVWTETAGPPPKPTQGGFYVTYSESREIARLDVHGKWIIPSWPDVERASREPSPTGYFRCILRELIARKAGLLPPETEERRCEGVSFDKVQEIIDHDPVIAACRDPILCKSGDVCS